MSALDAVLKLSDDEPETTPQRAKKLLPASKSKAEPKDVKPKPKASERKPEVSKAEPKPKAETPENTVEADAAESKPNKRSKKPPQMKRPAAAPKVTAAKRPASELSGIDEIKVRKYPYKRSGMWAISVNGKEFVQASRLDSVCAIVFFSLSIVCLMVD